MKPYILAIDPGTTESGVVLIRSSDCCPFLHAKLPNKEIYEVIDAAEEKYPGNVAYVIEMVASYGMPVGVEVFETVLHIGEFRKYIELQHRENAEFIYRKEEKLCICNSPKANDASIRQALADRFARGVPNHGKGSKKDPGWFYGFRADEWAAYAVAVTYRDKKKEEESI